MYLKSDHQKQEINLLSNSSVTERSSFESELPEVDNKMFHDKIELYDQSE